MTAWGRLFRLSLAPSAAADIAAGIVLAAGAWPPGFRAVALMLASLCVYHGGMALNDWADRETDLRARPDRPIPSGRVSASSALAAAMLLLVAGPALALVADPVSALVLAAVSLAAVVYDVSARGAWIGPLLLAACRAGNLSAGMIYGATCRVETADSFGGSLGVVSLGVDRATLVALAAAYAFYVFFVSRLGRLEDTESESTLGRAPSLYLAGAALMLLAPAIAALARVVHAELAEREAGIACAGAAFVAIWGSGPLAARAWKTRAWRKLDVLRAMGLALRRLLVFSAGTALIAGNAGWIVAAAILCGYPISYLLRGVFPPS
jgi:4-hydroxybenzoate polyprenyltransferase